MLPNCSLGLILTALLYRYNLVSTAPLYPFKTDIGLGEFNQISVNWRPDDVQERIYFALECSIESNVAWLAFGFSDHGEYAGSDLCLWNGFTFEDAYVDPRGSIRSDRKQDCHFDHIDRYPDGRMTIFFWREYDTCDETDYVIEEGTTHLVVVLGKTKRQNLFGDNVLKFIKPARIIQNVPAPSVKMASDVEVVEIRSKNATIPAQETTYWCTVFKLPPMFEKRHIIKYEAIIKGGNEQFVHHMEVYHCERPAVRRKGFPMYSGECHLPNVPSLVKSCKRVIGAWAMGAPPMVYPSEAGAPIGGPGYFPFVMLEVHYNNPAKKSGVIDASGMRFHVTSQLRTYDAGVIEAGLEYTDRMAIPPGQRSFALTGYCTPECTDSLLPNRGITIFASQLHSHLTGRQLSTSLIREGVELNVVNRDRHFSPHWQEIRPVKPTRMLPGDSLITTCVYDTSARENVTLGGYGITEEMCVNYIHYYPKSKLEVCKSAIETSALESFFEFVRRWDGQPTQSQLNVSENYKRIRWNEGLATELKTLYDVAPVRAECRRNDGELMKLSPREPVAVLYPLPEKTSHCDESSGSDLPID